TPMRYREGFRQDVRRQRASRLTLAVTGRTRPISALANSSCLTRRREGRCHSEQARPRQLLRHAARARQDQRWLPCSQEEGVLLVRVTVVQENAAKNLPETTPSIRTRYARSTLARRHHLRRVEFRQNVDCHPICAPPRVP